MISQAPSQLSGYSDLRYRDSNWDARRLDLTQPRNRLEKRSRARLCGGGGAVAQAESQSEPAATLCAQQTLRWRQGRFQVTVTVPRPSLCISCRLSRY